MQKTITKFGLLAILITTLCGAQQTSIQKEGSNWVSVVTGSLAGARNLHIQVEIGTVHVQGGSTQGINYVIRNRSYEGSEDRARKQFEGYKISANVRGDTAFITGEWENGSPHKFNSEITVNVPRDLELVKIETDGGEISTTGISGRLEAESGGGMVHLDDIGGAISAETGGGSIDVGNVGSDLTVRTGGGPIHIGSAKGKVVAESGGGNLVLVSGSAGASLQTGGGSIHVNKCTGEVKAETGGGSIDLGDIGGSVSMETGGGTLKVSSASGPIKGETGSGNIELWGVPSAHVETGSGAITAKFIRGGNGTSNSELETGVGDITVYLVSNVNLTIRASIEAANGQQIVSDFPEIKIASEGGGQWGPKLVSAEGSLNGGGPVLKVRTTMGNIYFRRAQ
ncbi:MAG TPA: hypothetical protein VL349_14015 [Terriglobales bacterium]|jgi:hypothetical protein|nr:hypothetical protein [Terriglobales bacterium]